MTTTNAAPSPLGWCSDCLVEPGEQVQAVTLFNGRAVCEKCNREWHQSQNRKQADVEESLAKLQHMRIPRPFPGR